ncbi:MAG: hypothetical protein NZ888_05205 [Candidatus Nitrosocaldus sp.]|nr:hypothetical protein [Candidatus Nitrosocaldus sp.]
MQAHRIIASKIIESAARLPLSHEEIPRLTGVAADFISKLISIPEGSIPIEVARRMDKARYERFHNIIDLLESQILEGIIDTDVKDRKGIVTEFMYKNKRFNLSLPVVRAASGIAELAPLALYL